MYGSRKAEPPLAVTVRGRLGEWLRDEDFAGTCGIRGRPSWSLSRLALVTVLQRAENLTDRMAAEQVRTRLDWKYLLVLGIVATLAAKVAHGLGHGLIGAMVAAWSAVALVGSYQLLMMIVRSEQVPAVTPGAHDDGPAADPLGERAAVVFAAGLEAARVPSIRAIRAALHVGQSRARRLRGYLATVAENHAENLAT